MLCYHSRDKYFFLPKGRRDAGEESGRAAEREGYEEARIHRVTAFSKEEVFGGQSVQSLTL